MLGKGPQSRNIEPCGSSYGLTGRPNKYLSANLDNDILENCFNVLVCVFLLSSMSTSDASNLSYLHPVFNRTSKDMLLRMNFQGQVAAIGKLSILG